MVTFPITPGELTIKIGSNNEVVNLINEGDINIPKSPSLIEVEFEARFPMRQYPYARKYVKFNKYWKIFKRLKEKKEPFRFIVVRKRPRKKDGRLWDTNLLMVIEDMELYESADEGDDVLITFKLKQYKEYGVVKIKRKTSKGKTSKKKTTVKKKRTTKKPKNKTYTVKKGDCLWLISKRFYGTGIYNKKIYQANKTIIEKTARKYGKKSSSNGWWIYPGTKLVIPAYSKDWK